MPLIDRAVNALDQLQLDGIGKRPLVFVCHSLGGLLIKQALRVAYEFRKAEYHEIAKQTKGLVFLSTPHAGSNIATWIQYLEHLLRATVTVEELEAHHPRLRELNTWFRNHPNTPKISMRVYCEKLPVAAGLLVVNETSADPGLAGVIPIPLDEDHISIVKPSSRSAQVYRGTLSLVDSVRDNTITEQKLVERLRDVVGSKKARRFRIALSFPGEFRAKVSAIAETLSARFGRGAVFYDMYYEAELARPDLDTYLQQIYHEEADLVVVFLCHDYERKEWCGLEWRAIRDLLKRKESNRIMFCRFDDESVRGSFSIDGYVSAHSRSPEEIADVIAKRLQLIESDSRDTTPTLGI